MGSVMEDINSFLPDNFFKKKIAFEKTIFI